MQTFKQTFQMSLLSLACVTALIACSSGKDNVDNYLNSQANLAQQRANQQAKEAEEKRKQAEAQVRELENRLLAAQNQLTEAQQQLSESLPSTEVDKLRKQLDAAQTELNRLTQQLTVNSSERTLLRQALENEQARAAQLQAQLDQIVATKQTELQEQTRLETNRKEVKKTVVDNGTFEKTYTATKSVPADPYGFSFKTEQVEETSTLTRVNGKHLVVKQGNLLDKPLTNQENLDQLIVDGKSITLYRLDDIRATGEREYQTKDLNENGLVGKLGSFSKSRSVDDFAQIRYGYVTDENGQTTLFVQGHTTPTEQNATSPFFRNSYGTDNQWRGVTLRKMPSGETAYRYTGTAFYGKEGNYQELTVNALADFQHKKVKAELKDGETTKVVLGGIIRGNTFVGEHNGVVTSGAFYGYMAQDLGGVFYQTAGEEKDKQGVFGATSPSGGRYGFIPDNVFGKENLADFQVKE